MDARSIVQQSIQKCQTLASDMRQAASQATNSQAKTILSDTASNLESSVKQMRSIINQL